MLETQNGSQPMSNKRSSQSGHGGAFVNTGTAVPPLALNTWQQDNDEPFSAFTATSVSPRPAKARKTATGCHPIRIPDYSSNIKEFDPADYVQANQSTLSPAFSPGLRSRRNSNQRYSPSSPLSRSPATNSDGFTSIPTPDTSVAMSRDDSLGGSSFYDPLKMMRIGSQRSDAVSSSYKMVHDSPQALGPMLDSSNNPITDVSPFNFSLSVSHAQGADEVYTSSPQPVSDNLTLPFVVEEDTPMSRTISSQSTDSAKSRVMKRSEEQAVLSRRIIAPKDNAEPMSRQSSASSSLSCDMNRHRSADGLKVSIPKAKYQRKQPEKIRCDFCNKKPEGYRGPHELRRHIDNKHAGETRRVWVCRDQSSDQMFLAKCKHCMDNKKYGAYYNAAAHLRRIHFNPKEKGKKGDKSAKARGGNGGGDFPAMEILKLWIEEMTESATENKESLKDSSQDEGPADDMGNDEAHDYALQPNNTITNEPDFTPGDDVVDADCIEPQYNENVQEDQEGFFGQPELSQEGFSASFNPPIYDNEFDNLSLPLNFNINANDVYGATPPSTIAAEFDGNSTMMFASVNHRTHISTNVEPTNFSFTPSMNNSLDQFDYSAIFGPDCTNFS